MLDGAPRILVTGAHGFVGRHLVERLSETLPRAQLLLADRRSGPPPAHGRAVEIDITDANALDQFVAAERPTHLVHLAAIAAVTEATGDAKLARAINYDGTRNLALAVSRQSPECRFVFCSSAEIYGASFKAGHPLDETAELQPVNAYGMAKADADSLLGDMAKNGFRVIRLRPVNHTGPGQNTQFVVPDFASQIAKIERGGQPAVIRVGNLASARDFLDVRDVVDAYARALTAFDELPNGCAINIASGEARTIGSVLDDLLALSPCRIEARTDESLFRESDTPIAVCDASRARRLLGWSPQHRWPQTLASVLEYWRARP